jgi:glycosyltransferase involved in cell wall biosynthesis
MLLHTVQSLQLAAGGPSYSVPALARALQEAGMATEIWTPDPAPPEWPGLTIRQVPAGKLGVMLEQAKAAASKAGQGVIVHDHGIWLPWNHAVARAAMAAGVPRVVSPRGMMEPWAMQYKRWKKRIAWALYQKRDLNTAALLHATAESERSQLTHLKLQPGVVVAPNGVDLPDESVLATHDPTAKERTALFLSRIHPKKGLLDLVQAWAKAAPAGWRLVIAGPDEGGHQAAVQAAVASAGLADVVHFPGPLAGPAKARAYQEADLFVLPSYSENFGLVIAEALAAGLPVITTHGTPWAELEETGCGWWIPPGPGRLTAALQQATALAPAERQAMGRCGRHLISTRYTWPAIAQQMREAYGKLRVES